MTMYPVHIDAHLDEKLSRWQWLFKWLLAIPHYVILAFLWVAFVVLSMVAFFAILFTGRYPRGIFDFNVGVLRWSWRVAYYAYGALGTDRYPPFSLGEEPDYPAHLAIEYPDHLSRGLVLVKWWLLAIPHYLVLALFLGGTYVVFEAGANDEVRTGGLGLIGVLVLVAAVVLLVTGRYPQPVFDLVLGLNRWVLRVAGYAALMTDEYPPFRLDQGGDDPDAGRLQLTSSGPAATTGSPSAGTVGSPPAPAAGAGGAPSYRWGAGRVITVIAAGVLLLSGAGAGLGGAALVAADQAGRDDAGFLTSPSQVISTGGYAVATERMEINADGASWVPETFIGDARVTAEANGDSSVFVGVADSADADAYLAGVQHSTVQSLDGSPGYTDVDGQAPTVPPSEAGIWVASGTGDDPAVTWPVETGDWTVVLMNEDGSRGVSADVTFGATVPALTGIATGLLVGAGILLVAGALMLVAALATLPRRS